MPTCGLLSAVRVRRAHRCGAVRDHGVLAILFSVSTVSILFNAPDVSESAGRRFGSTSPVGAFLLKDPLLLTLSFWALTDWIRVTGALESPVE